MRSNAHVCLQALKWQAERTPAQVIDEREKMVVQLEAANAAMHASGMCERRVAPGALAVMRCCSGWLQVVWSV